MDRAVYHIASSCDTIMATLVPNIDVFIKTCRGSKQIPLAV